MTNQQLILGTRGSKLALWQANYIADRLQQRYPELTITIKQMMTTGDKILDVPLAKIGGKGLFTKELDLAMLTGEIDIAVHSLKDMPTELPPGLTLAAVTTREHPGDAFISHKYCNVESLPPKAVIGTSSLRRKAQLLAARPDLHIIDLRGNVDTRLHKLITQNLDGIVLAVAGLQRLELEDKITQILPLTMMLPAVGQGVLALQARENDKKIVELLSSLEDPLTRQATVAERTFLRRIEGDCQVPVGVYATIVAAELVLEAVIVSLDGKIVIRKKLAGRLGQAEEIGTILAKEMLAAGGQSILAAIVDKERIK